MGVVWFDVFAKLLGFYWFRLFGLVSSFGLLALRLNLGYLVIILDAFCAGFCC